MEKRNSWQKEADEERSGEDWRGGSEMSWGGCRGHGYSDSDTRTCSHIILLSVPRSTGSDRLYILFLSLLPAWDSLHNTNQ